MMATRPASHWALGADFKSLAQALSQRVFDGGWHGHLDHWKFTSWPG
jgi:hypothetical protein